MKTSKIIALNGIIASLYAAITIACAPLSYSFMQVRISELLNLLVFFNPTFTVGLTIGCLIANIFSSLGPLDIAIGTATTLVACLLMVLFSHFVKNLLFAGLIPCLLNAITVPLTIILTSGGTFPLDAGTYFMMFGWVFLGEFIAIIVIGYPLFLFLSKKNKQFYNIMNATRNTDYKW